MQDFFFELANGVFFCFHFSFCLVKQGNRAGSSPPDYFGYYVRTCTIILLYTMQILLVPQATYTGDNGNAMFPSKVRISKMPAKRFLYRSV